MKALLCIPLANATNSHILFEMKHVTLCDGQINCLVSISTEGQRLVSNYVSVNYLITMILVLDVIGSNMKASEILENEFLHLPARTKKDFLQCCEHCGLIWLAWACFLF